MAARKIRVIGYSNCYFPTSLEKQFRSFFIPALDTAKRFGMEHFDRASECQGREHIDTVIQLQISSTSSSRVQWMFSHVLGCWTSDSLSPFTSPQEGGRKTFNYSKISSGSEKNPHKFIKAWISGGVRDPNKRNILREWRSFMMMARNDVRKMVVTCRRSYKSAIKLVKKAFYGSRFGVLKGFGTIINAYSTGRA